MSRSPNILSKHFVVEVLVKSKCMFKFYRMVNCPPEWHSSIWHSYQRLPLLKIPKRRSCPKPIKSENLWGVGPRHKGDSNTQTSSQMLPQISGTLRQANKQRTDDAHLRNFVTLLDHGEAETKHIQASRSRHQCPQQALLVSQILPTFHEFGEGRKNTKW